jgi:hypothetical protein
MDGVMVTEAVARTPYSYCTRGASYVEITDGYLSYINAEQLKGNYGILSEMNVVVFKNFMDARYHITVRSCGTSKPETVVWVASVPKNTGESADYSGMHFGSHVGLWDPFRQRSLSDFNFLGLKAAAAAEVAAAGVLAHKMLVFAVRARSLPP